MTSDACQIGSSITDGNALAFSGKERPLPAQRRDGELASHREQLTLESNILSEQKAAKLIELLEELRRALASFAGRVDPEAAAFATPSDPQVILDAIKRSYG